MTEVSSASLTSSGLLAAKGNREPMPELRLTPDAERRELRPEVDDVAASEKVA